MVQSACYLMLLPDVLLTCDAPACLCRFSDWVMSTSPYTGQKTPPTVSMMSVRADENTPPHLQEAAAAAAGEALHAVPLSPMRHPLG
jgi:hypothetical protein